MFSRRLLRIKVFQTIYAFFQSENSTFAHAEKELLTSLNKIYDLYFYLFLLILDISLHAENKLDKAKQKFFSTPEDLNPNTRFIDNRVIQQIRENNQLHIKIKEKKLNWQIYPELVTKLFQLIQESEEYKKYMESDTNNYEDDKNFLIFVYEEILYNNDLLFEIVEEQSIYWHDATDFCIDMISKTIDHFKISNDSTHQLMPMFKNDDDKEFTLKLLHKTIIKNNEHRELIKKHLENWDIERVSLTDIIILQMAITEATEFPSIPLKVTFDEFLEISKYFSSEKSRTFINGILDKILKDLKKSNKIVKTGRGLIGDNEK